MDERPPTQLIIQEEPNGSLRRTVRIFLETVDQKIPYYLEAIFDDRCEILSSGVAFSYNSDGKLDKDGVFEPRQSLSMYWTEDEKMEILLELQHVVCDMNGHCFCDCPNQEP